MHPGAPNSSGRAAGRTAIRRGISLPGPIPDGSAGQGLRGAHYLGTCGRPTRLKKMHDSGLHRCRVTEVGEPDVKRRARLRDEGQVPSASRRLRAHSRIAIVRPEVSLRAIASIADGISSKPMTSPTTGLIFFARTSVMISRMIRSPSS